MADTTESPLKPLELPTSSTYSWEFKPTFTFMQSMLAALSLDPTIAKIERDIAEPPDRMYIKDATGLMLALTPGEVRQFIASGTHFLDLADKKHNERLATMRGKAEKNAADPRVAILDLKCGNCNRRFDGFLQKGEQLVERKEEGAFVRAGGARVVDRDKDFECPNCGTRERVRVVGRRPNVDRMLALEWLETHPLQKAEGDVTAVRERLVKGTMQVRGLPWYRTAIDPFSDDARVAMQKYFSIDDDFQAMLLKPYPSEISAQKSMLGSLLAAVKFLSSLVEPAPRQLVINWTRADDSDERNAAHAAAEPDRDDLNTGTEKK